MADDEDSVGYRAQTGPAVAAGYAVASEQSSGHALDICEGAFIAAQQALHQCGLPVSMPNAAGLMMKICTDACGELDRKLTLEFIRQFAIAFETSPAACGGEPSAAHLASMRRIGEIVVSLTEIQIALLRGGGRG